MILLTDDISLLCSWGKWFGINLLVVRFTVFVGQMIWNQPLGSKIQPHFMPAQDVHDDHYDSFLPVEVVLGWW